MAAATPRPFVGRPEALEALRRRRARVAAGHGAVSVIEGEGGVGKSTLLAAFLAECRKGGDRVLVARARPGAEPPPFQLVREALGVTSRIDPGAPAPADGEETPKGAERLAEMLRSLGDSAEPTRPRSFAPLAEPFFQLAAAQPTIVAFEDIRHADAPSLEFLEFLAPLIGAHRLWVLLTGPPVRELPEASRHLLESLPRDDSVDRITLRALNPSEVAEFVQWVDPNRAPRPQELTLWFTQTGGNPLFLEQILRARRRATPTIWNAAGERGAGVSEYLRERLAEIPEEERRVLALAAVIGREFPFPLLYAATGLDEERLAELVERLVDRGVLRETPPDHIEFARNDLRELVYGGLTETLKRLLHQRVAEALEVAGRTDPDTIFALAHHYYFAKVDAKAVQFNRAAAEFAARVVSPEIARTHLERALECLRRAPEGERPEELEIVLELALALDRVGELERAEALLREALGRGPPLAGGGPAAELLPIYLARILTDEGRWDDARHLTDELLDHVDRLGAPAARLALYRLRGEIEYYRGEYADALRHHDHALEIARTQGDRREVALVLVRRANALAMMPDCVAEAVPAYREASEELLSLGDRAEAAYALLFLGVTLSQNGRTTEGLAELERAAELAEESSDLRELGWALFNIADLRRELGELPSACDANRRAREILTRIGDQFGLAQTFIIGGKIGIAQRTYGEAERELLEAFRIVRELRTEPDELEVLLRLAEVALAQGAVKVARERANELERRSLSRLRPDLIADMNRLLGNLRPPSESASAAVAA